MRIKTPDDAPTLSPEASAGFSDQVRCTKRSTDQTGDNSPISPGEEKVCLSQFAGADRLYSCANAGFPLRCMPPAWAAAFVIIHEIPKRHFVLA